MLHVHTRMAQVKRTQSTMEGKWTHCITFRIAVVTLPPSSICLVHFQRINLLQGMFVKCREHLFTLLNIIMLMVKHLAFHRRKCCIFSFAFFLVIVEWRSYQVLTAAGIVISWDVMNCNSRRLDTMSNGVGSVPGVPLTIANSLGRGGPWQYKLQVSKLKKWKYRCNCYAT